MEFRSAVICTKCQQPSFREQASAMSVSRFQASRATSSSTAGFGAVTAGKRTSRRAQKSRNDQAFLLLHDIIGSEHNETAGLLGCSAGCSKSQLHKARKRLRGLLEGDQARAEPGIVPAWG
jgi:hypothetical protein